MKHISKFFFGLFLTTISVAVYAQTNIFPATGAVGVGTTAPDPSALLEMKSTTSGLLIPKMTITQRDAILTPASGLMIYQTNFSPGFYFFDGRAWQKVVQWSSSSSGIFYNSGNVGIGTSAPVLGGLVVDRKVGTNNAVFGSNTTGVTIQSNYPGIGFNTFYNAGNKFIAGGFGSYAGLDPTNGLFYISNTTAKGTKDSSASLNTRFAITATGNVGIGTTTPSSKLGVRISGTSGYTSQYTNGTIDLRTYLGNDLNGGFAQLGTFSNHPLRLNTYANFNQFHLATSGLVGVGTNFPTKAGLTVNTKAGSVNAMFGDNTYGVAIESNYPGMGLNTYYNEGRKFIRSGYGGYIGLDPTSGLLGFYNTSSSGSTNAAADVFPRLAITAAGNVGIGTTASNSAGLTVDTKVGAVNALFGSNTTGVAIESSYPGVGLNTYFNNGRKFINAGYGALLSLDPTNGTFVIYNSAASGVKDANIANFIADLAITATGNVGIGTTTPAYKLEVCGTVRAKELRVETGWCDYVFDKNYKLRSLSEVEKFINTNKHLPEVTPGAEIEKGGLEVGKVSSQMIRKIEELTLYIIEQEKSINFLKEQNAKFEAKMNLSDKKGGK